MCIAHKISHGTNVVVVNIQSNSREKKFLFADWLFTTTTFVPWDILWAMLMAHLHKISQKEMKLGRFSEALNGRVCPNIRKINSNLQPFFQVPAKKAKIKSEIFLHESPHRWRPTSAGPPAGRGWARSRPSWTPSSPSPRSR